MENSFSWGIAQKLISIYILEISNFKLELLIESSMGVGFFSLLYVIEIF